MFLSKEVNKQGGWTESYMRKATYLVLSGTLSVREASLRFVVPKSTLHDRKITIICKTFVDISARLSRKNREEEGKT